MRFKAQGFDQYVLENAYKKEEEDFIKTVELVTRDQVPPDTNVFKSYSFYKIKINNDASMKLKDRIAPHGNEDNMKNELSRDCATCSPAGLRILESIAALFRWTLIIVDSKTAFLQTRNANRKVLLLHQQKIR